MVFVSKIHAEEDGHNEGDRFGVGKAIVAVNESKGFKLSKESISTLGIIFRKISGERFEIDKDTLITSKDFKGVYRYKEGFFKVFPIQIQKEEKGRYWVTSRYLNPGDLIVVKSAGLLRVADIYSTDKAEYSE